MFCQKCGNKLEENIAFCPRCGVRLPVANAAKQPINYVVILDEKKADKTVQPIDTATKAYELLQKNATLCPEVRSLVLEEHRSTAVVVGKINKYSVLVMNGQIGLDSFPVFPFVIPMWLCCLSEVLSLALAYIMSTYYYSDVSKFMLPNMLLGVLSALSGIGVSVFGNKEKKIVLSFIRKTLSQPKYIEHFSYTEMVTYSVCIILFPVLFLFLI